MTKRNLSGKAFVSQAALDSEPKNCIGKHWIGDYVVLGETCHYCGWWKEPLGVRALVNANRDVWERRVRVRREWLEAAEDRLAYWRSEKDAPDLIGGSAPL